ncbi:Sodium/calcium exchanger protein-domain-containing protein [Scheffersomyces xylosifermentans]|uniref:Sodium/calcium exchanger protein-domain-containing protein n=1 Tax=Scheffersomyces xylosifermentans TaxID=1304137 RepID=UPI00315CBE08
MKIGKLVVVTTFLTIVSGFSQLGNPFSIRHPELTIRTDNDNHTCPKVYDIDRDSQCSYVQEHCSSEEYNIGRFNYLSAYYCRFGFLGAFSFVPLVVTLAIFFISLGLTASDYLCPNLYTISKFLKLSDNLAGLTLLALGNGSPDVLSTFKAMSVGSGSLAISELIGASLFITTAIIGSIAIVHPLKVPRRSFVRDVGFYLIIACLLIFTLYLNRLTLVVSFILASSYVIYVVVVVLDHSFLKKQISKRLSDARSRANFSLSDEPNHLNERSSTDEIDDIYLDTFATLPTIEELNLQNQTEPINEELESFLRSQGTTKQSNVHVGIGSYGLKLLLKELQKYSHLQGQIHLDSNRPLTAPVVSNSERLYDGEGSEVHSAPTGPDFRRNLGETEYRIESPALETQELDNELHSMLRMTSTTNWLSYLRRNYSLLMELLAPQLADFTHQSLTNKVYNILTFPTSTLLRLSTPVRDQSILSMLLAIEKSRANPAFSGDQNHFEDEEEEEEQRFNFELDRILLTAQIFIGTNFVNYIYFGETKYYWSVWFLLGLIIAAGTSKLVHINYNTGNFTSHDLFKMKLINRIASFYGFVIAISWISIFATEIIGILKSISIIYKLSDDILGVTVFALGNSIGDLISNFTIAKMGMPVMAFGACFGGPLLSLCSFGLSGLFIIPRNNMDSGYPLEFTRTLGITCAALVANILCLFYIVPRNNWMLDQKIGTLLICNYGVAASLCIISELSK